MARRRLASNSFADAEGRIANYFRIGTAGTPRKIGLMSCSMFRCQEYAQSNECIRLNVAGLRNLESQPHRVLPDGCWIAVLSSRLCIEMRCT